MKNTIDLVWWAAALLNAPQCLMNCSVLRRVMRILWAVCTRPTWPASSSSWGAPAQLPARDNPAVPCPFTAGLHGSIPNCVLSALGAQGSSVVNESGAVPGGGLLGADAWCRVPLSMWSQDWHFTNPQYWFKKHQQFAPWKQRVSFPARPGLRVCWWIIFCSNIFFLPIHNFVSFLGCQC